MKPLTRSQKLGSTNTDEWIQFQLKKCSEEQKAKKPFRTKECRIYISPEDERQIKIDDLRKKREAKESSRDREIKESQRKKEKEMEERRRKYIDGEIDNY